MRKPTYVGPTFLTPIYRSGVALPSFPLASRVRRFVSGPLTIAAIKAARARYTGAPQYGPALIHARSICGERGVSVAETLAREDAARWPI